MAKATTSKSGTKSIASDEPINSPKNEILVERDGVQRTFSRLIWDQLPPKKEGWKEVKEAPSEPKTKAPAKDEKPKAKEEADKTKKSEEPKKEEAPKKFIEKTLTQEDFDANPSLADDGLKIGDTIEIEDYGKED